MPDSVYFTKVSATGGRHGSICSDDGLLNLKLALPRTHGGEGDATNPEQLFAGAMQCALRMRSFT
jgi:osmotically inducible protein OsmC